MKGLSVESDAEMSDTVRVHRADWPRYYAAVGNRPPYPTLLEALQRFDSEAMPEQGPRQALDLGCGSGRDTRELLRRGWRVLAIDSEPQAITHLQMLQTTHPCELQVRLGAFQSVSLPTADLINASYALPFCPPAAFQTLWQHIVDALHPGGRFAGQFFGPRDSWAETSNMTFLTRETVVQLLKVFEVELLHEGEVDRPTALGQPKHWHVFDIVARKLAPQ